MNVMNIFYVLCITLYPVYVLSTIKHDPLLVVVIMVKDEDTVIDATLRPFVKAGIDSFFVFDTGSTDDTIAVAKKIFADNTIVHGYIETETFIDFATSRNRALERAQQLFPYAEFMIMIDAEWYLNDVQGLIDFCYRCLACNDIYTTYLIRIINDGVGFYVPRLIRCGCNAQFEGVVHETIISQTRVKVPPTIYFEYRPTKYGTSKTRKRHQKDKELLYKEYTQKPSPRTLFYLAFTCEVLGDLQEAYDLYKQRIQYTSFDEEDFMSYYRLAQTIEKLSYVNSSYTWEEALYYYIKDAKAGDTLGNGIAGLWAVVKQ